MPSKQPRSRFLWTDDKVHELLGWLAIPRHKASFKKHFAADPDSAKCKKMYTKIRASNKLFRTATNAELKLKLSSLSQIYVDFANGYFCVGDNAVAVSKLAHAFADGDPCSNAVLGQQQNQTCSAALDSSEDSIPLIILSDSESDSPDPASTVFPICEVDNSRRSKRSRSEMDASFLSLDSTFVESNEQAWFDGDSADRAGLPELALEIVKQSAHTYSADPRTSESLLAAVNSLVDAQNEVIKLKRREIEVNLRFVVLKEQKESRRQARHCAKLIVQATKDTKSSRKK